MLMRWGLYRALQQNKANQQKKTLPNQKRQNIHEQQWQSNDKMTKKTKLATAAIYDWHSHIQSYSSFVQIPTGKAYRCINDRLHSPKNHIQQLSLVLHTDRANLRLFLPLQTCTWSERERVIGGISCGKRCRYERGHQYCRASEHSKPAGNKH